MKILITTLFFLNIIILSFQTCTKFGQIDISPVDVTNLVSSITKLGKIPKLFATARYASPEQIAKDVEDYNSGLNNEDAHLNMTELVQKYGFGVEEHTVTTKDGYILTLFRIFGEKSNNRVAYLNHGFIGSSFDWIMAQEQSLPYLLAQEGYDVWLGNNRGNKFSRNHVSISPDCSEFWDFSNDEIALYDLPAIIDYVLEKTNQKKLFYVGFSQGTASFFAMTSELPEYNDKIYEMFALAPIAWITNVQSPLLRILAPNHDVLYLLLNVFGSNEFAPNSVVTKTLAGLLCEDNAVSAIFCNSLVNLIFGFDRGQMNMNYLYTIFQHFPAGASTKQLQQFGQRIVSGHFRRFEYNTSKNIEEYGSENPPDYNVENISTKVNLFYSKADWVSTDKDVEKLAGKLKNLGEMILVDDYNHLDFNWAANVKDKVYDIILKVMKNNKTISEL